MVPPCWRAIRQLLFQEFVSLQIPCLKIKLSCLMGPYPTIYIFIYIYVESTLHRVLYWDYGKIQFCSCTTKDEPFHSQPICQSCTYTWKDIENKEAYWAKITTKTWKHHQKKVCKERATVIVLSSMAVGMETKTHHRLVSCIVLHCHLL